MQRSDQPNLSPYAVSVAAVICIEIGRSDDIAALNIITLATNGVSSSANASRILAHKAEKEGKTSNQFHYTRQANGLLKPLHVSNNSRKFITALINYQFVEFQLRHYHHIGSCEEETH